MHGWDIQSITQHKSSNVHKQTIYFLIETMQLYHVADEQWNNLKAILIDNKDGFTDDPWKMVFHLLNENTFNDEQFGIFVDMLDNSTQKLVLLHAGGGTGFFCYK